MKAKLLAAAGKLKKGTSVSFRSRAGADIDETVRRLAEGTQSERGKS